MNSTLGVQGRNKTMPTGSAAAVHDLPRDTVGCMTRLYREYGPMVAYPNGSDQTVFAFGPEANHDVLCDPSTFRVFGPPGSKNSSQRRFMLGLFGLDGAKQKQHRRLIMPALSKPAVELAAAAMRDVIEEFLSGWRTGQQIDLYGSMKKLSLWIACKLLFGLDSSVADHVPAAFQEWLDGYIHVLFSMTSPVPMTSRYYQDWLARGALLEAKLRDLIARREATLADGRHDLLAILLRAHHAGQLSEDEVVGEMQTMFNASYQTTAGALTWTLLLLTQHPEVMGPLHDEWQRARLPEQDQLSLLDAVLRESLRVLPPVIFYVRRAVRPAVVAGHALPKDTVIFLSIYVTHHMEESFPDPESFRPRRWHEQHVSPYAYLPFGAGSRMCVGTSFSLQLMQLVVPAILRRFRLALVPGTRVDRHSNLTMGVRGALPVILHEQDGRFTTVPLTGEIQQMVRFPPGVVTPAKAA